jgi:hypothetical protein
MRWSLLWVASVLCSGVQNVPGSAAQTDWVSQVFPERTHDFGVVARGSVVRYAFPVVNRTDFEVRILDWKTKCGCTNVRVGSKVIPPGTQTTIEATIDTTRFQGNKSSGLTLTLDRPSLIVVDLNVNCFIRTDITMSPGFIDFGVVRPAEKPATSALVLSYAGGRSDWEIADMKTQTARVKAVAKEIGRSASGRIEWNITATLEPGQPNGYFKDEILIITNESPPQKIIPISVVANIQSAVSVSPSIINFGSLKPGQSVSKSVRVRSSSPFSIVSLSGSESALEAVEEKKEAATDHTISVTLKAPDTPGPFHAILKVESDVKDEPAAQIKTFATINASP